MGPVGVTFHDRRAEAKRFSPALVYGSRGWDQVTGITLHQTACLLGERPARWDSVGCHVGVTRGGQIIQLHDFTEVVVHGNGWNNRCVGIEMDGLYAGLEGDMRTVWDDPSTPIREQGMAVTDELVEAACAAVKWIYDEVAARGGAIKFLVAHRQSSIDRRNDPGEALWKRVGLRMQDELGLSHGDDLGFKLGGYSIPEAWDPRCVGVPY